MQSVAQFVTRTAPSLIRLAFPPQCLGCGEMVGVEHGLCGKCWKDTPFLHGLCCDSCGVPLPGDDDGVAVHCDDCITIARPWEQGRAALAYRDTARRLVLALKHGDRTDLLHPLATWMAHAGRCLLQEDTVLVPVPLHRMRLIKRRYNQAALLAKAIGAQTQREVLPDLLVRTRSTKAQEGMTREARFTNQSEAITASPSAKARLAGRAVLIVDDVMTSGATFAAAAEASYAAGARRVDILALARAVKDT
ncbi:MAG: double zinc ribbon domain-containing protein [Pseudomonadota bacterium]